MAKVRFMTEIWAMNVQHEVLQMKVLQQQTSHSHKRQSQQKIQTKTRPATSSPSKWENAAEEIKLKNCSQKFDVSQHSKPQTEHVFTLARTARC